MSNCQRFSDISVSERILNTLFLLSIALGYLFSLGQVFFIHQGRDGLSGLSIDDIMIAYHGSPSQTRLSVAINGPMAGNLKSADEKAVILDWIDSGAPKALDDRYTVYEYVDRHICLVPDSGNTGFRLFISRQRRLVGNVFELSDWA